MTSSTGSDLCLYKHKNIRRICFNKKKKKLISATPQYKHKKNMKRKKNPSEFVLTRMFSKNGSPFHVYLAPETSRQQISLTGAAVSLNCILIHATVVSITADGEIFDLSVADMRTESVACIRELGELGAPRC